MQAPIDILVGETYLRSSAAMAVENGQPQFNISKNHLLWEGIVMGGMHYSRSHDVYMMKIRCRSERIKVKGWTFFSSEDDDMLGFNRNEVTPPDLVSVPTADYFVRLMKQYISDCEQWNTLSPAQRMDMQEFWITRWVPWVRFSWLKTACAGDDEENLLALREIIERGYNFNDGTCLRITLSGPSENTLISDTFHPISGSEKPN